VAVVRINVLENILPPSSGFLRVIGPHSFVTVVSSVIKELVVCAVRA
jgi:hypothetical protein